MATVLEVRDLLAATSLPPALVDELLQGASPVWLMGEAAPVIAGDLALCHPLLGPEEVRAAVMPTTDADVWRLSVVAHDRGGLLAGTAGALATHGLSVVRASVSTWPQRGLALQRVLATHPGGLSATSDRWDRLGDDLKAALGRDQTVAPVFDPVGPVTVSANCEAGGRTLVRVRAPDRVGLLWAVAQWMADHDCNIEVARVDGDGDMTDDTFIVEGAVDAADLAAYLSGGQVADPNPLGWLVWPARVAIGAVGVGAWAAKRLLRRGP